MHRDGEDDFVAFSTNSVFNDGGCTNRVPVATATAPFGDWTTPDDNPSAEDQSFEWEGTQPCFNWAPDVHKFGSTYVLYMTARSKYYSNPQRQCIGTATTTDLDVPFEPQGDSAIVCTPEFGGAIDPSVFIDDNGAPWLLWKSDGNAIGQLPNIFAQRLSGTGLSVQGPIYHLLTVSQAWESGGSAYNSVVEAPEMVKVGGHYYLFYSGNQWETANYAIGYAACPPPQAGVGCTKPQDGPIMASGPLGHGPGGQSLFRDDSGQLMMAYHAWRPNQVGYPGGDRTFRISVVNITGGYPPVFG